MVIFTRSWPKRWSKTAKIGHFSRFILNLGYFDHFCHFCHFSGDFSKKGDFTEQKCLSKSGDFTSKCVKNGLFLPYFGTNFVNFRPVFKGFCSSEYPFKYTRGRKCKNSKTILFHPICMFGKNLYPKSKMAEINVISGIIHKRCQNQPFSVISGQNLPSFLKSPGPKCPFCTLFGPQKTQQNTRGQESSPLSEQKMTTF